MAEAAPAPVDQAEYWNGEVGRRWAEHQERMDLAFTALTAALLERAAVRPGERVVDVGCGCGGLALEVARRLGAEGEVLGVDLSRPMLERARARAGARPPGSAPITLQEADAAAFGFPEAGADLVISRFGTMFFADPEAALRNLRQALRPGGRLAMLCWRPATENGWVSLPRAAILQVVPPPPPLPPETPGPFAFADAARVGALLAEAGFTTVRSAPVDAKLNPFSAPDLDPDRALDEATAFLTEMGPASALLRDVDPETKARAVTAVRAALRARAGGGKPALDAACWLFTAERTLP